MNIHRSWCKSALTTIEEDCNCSPIRATAPTIGPQLHDWKLLLEEMAEWQQRQFPETTVEGARNHLEREVKVELKDDPSDPEEWADTLFLAVQGGWKASGDLGRFFVVVNRKMEKNLGRAWPTEPDTDNVYEHVKPVTAQDAERLIPKGHENRHS